MSRFRFLARGALFGLVVGSALAGCEGDVLPWDDGLLLVPAGGEWMHGCPEGVSAVYQFDDGTVLLACDLSAELYTISLDSLLESQGSDFFDGGGLVVNAIQEAWDGEIYLSGYVESGAADVGRPGRDRAGQVSRLTSDGLELVYDGGMMLGVQDVVGFARQESGLDLVLANDLLFAHRQDEGEWELGVAEDGFEFGALGAGLVDHDGVLVALGSHNLESAHLLLQNEGELSFKAVDLSSDGNIALTSLASDGEGLVVGANNETSQTGLFFTAEGSFSTPSGWRQHDLSEIGLDGSTVNAVCRYDGRSVVVGEWEGKGFIVEVYPEELTVDISVEESPPLTACHLSDRGLVVAGSNGYIHVESLPLPL